MLEKAQLTAGTQARERRIRLAAVLTSSGLLVLLLTLLRVHPLAFIAYIVIGCPLVGIGIVLYLYSIIGYGPAPETDFGEQSHSKSL
jgi:hypothetical protein